MSFYDTADAIYGTGQYGAASYGIVTPTVSITGVSATALTRTLHINAFEVDITEPLYGPNALTGSIGTLEFANTVTLSGVASTGQIGTVSPNIAFDITGVSATGVVNTVFENITEKVTGVVGTFTLNAAGLDIRSINRVPVTGDVGTTAVGTIQVNISESISSVSATGQIGTIKPNVAESAVGVEGQLNPLKPFTASGNAQLSTAEKKFGTASLLLDGTGDFVTTSYTSSLLTSSEWGVDFWVYSSTLTSQTAHLWDAQNSNSGFALRISSGTLQVIKDGSITRSVTGQLSNDTWHHIRLQRRYAFTEVFVDGFQRGQQAGAGYNAHTYVIGAKENGSEEFTGYIDEFRASTPTGLSAASFTPETEAYSLDGSTEALLHFDGTNGSTTITNEASNVITVTATGTANVTPTGVEGVGQIGEVEDQPLERIATGVFATGAIGSLTLHTTAGVDGVVGTFTVGTPTVTGVVTTFTATAYDRRNVANTLPKQTSSQRRAA